MRRIFRRLVFYPLLLAFAAAGAGWLLHAPHRPERLFRAVPAHAEFVSLHRRLSARWESVVDNPGVARTASVLAGMEIAAWRREALRPAFRSWVERLCARETVFAAYRPGRGRPPVWMMATWLGGQSQRFRWMLAAGRVPGFVRIGDHGGRPLWMAHNLLLPPDRHLCLAMEEGLLLACLSEDPREIRRILDAYDGTAPSVTGGARWLLESAPDCGFWDLGYGPGPDRLEFRLDRVGTEDLRGRVEVLGWEVRLPDPSEHLGAPDSSVLPAGAPEVVAVVNPAWLRTVAPGPAGSLWAAEAWDLVDRQTTGAVTLALFGDPLGGRFRGLRVPGMIGAAALRAPAELDAAVGAAMDRLNARHQWGLIAGADPEVPALRRFESTADNVYARMPPEERLSYVATNGWGLVGSNADTLGSLLDLQQPGGQGGEAAPWTPVADEAAAGAFLWADLTRAPETLRLALSVYDLTLLVKDPERNARPRAWIRKAKEWTEYAGAFQRLRAVARSGAAGPTVEFAFEGLAHAGAEAPRSD